MAQQHKCNSSHLTANAAQYQGQHCLERGTYHLTPASFTLATVNKTVLKHKPPAHTQKLCVIKQLHNTQRVSMTTRKLLGKLPKKLPLYPCLSQPCALLERRSKLTFGTKHNTSSGTLLERQSSTPWASQGSELSSSTEPTTDTTD